MATKLTIGEAFEIVLELAEQNVFEPEPGDGPELKQERKRQLSAIEIVRRIAKNQGFLH